MVKYFCEHPLVYARNCLTVPFILEADEDFEMSDKFPEQRAEIAPLFLCIMLNNREIFRYLWN